MTIVADGGSADEDGGQNGRATFETSSMKRTIGTTGPPPADGIQPGDMFCRRLFLPRQPWRERCGLRIIRHPPCDMVSISAVLSLLRQRTSDSFVRCRFSER